MRDRTVIGHSEEGESLSGWLDKRSWIVRRFSIALLLYPLGFILDLVMCTEPFYVQTWRKRNQF